MRSQRGKYCVSVKLGAAAQRENPPFKQSATRIKRRMHRLRTKPTFTAVLSNARFWPVFPLHGPVSEPKSLYLRGSLMTIGHVSQSIVGSTFDLTNSLTHYCSISASLTDAQTKVVDPLLARLRTADRSISTLCTSLYPYRSFQKILGGAQSQR